MKITIARAIDPATGATSETGDTDADAATNR